MVEGRYDKNTLSQVVDGVILETAGFGVFRNSELVTLLRHLAEKQGLIILTDSDGAGFVIRNFLKGALPSAKVKHAYVPDIYGKERRKRTRGKEGKLGVEGMNQKILLAALERAGATFLDEAETHFPRTARLTKADLFSLGLTGTANSAERRAALLKKLELPEHLNANALLTVLNALYTREALINLLSQAD